VFRVLVVALFVACTACSSLGTGPKLDIIATEYSYSPSNIPLDTNMVNIAIHNQGQEEHDFELIGPQGIVAHIEVVQPGITRGMSVSLKPGTYQFICTLEGHAQRGMSGTLTVK
jgi:uncharacterized cupredoxin-like copper-binding protein